MSTVYESTADLTSVAQHLETLAMELRATRSWRIPEISAACDALACAAALLRTQQDSPDNHAKHTDLLLDAIALARSTVEATKFAARERAGSQPLGTSERI